MLLLMNKHPIDSKISSYQFYDNLLAREGTDFSNKEKNKNKNLIHIQTMVKNKLFLNWWEEKLQFE